MNKILYSLLNTSRPQYYIKVFIYIKLPEYRVIFVNVK